MIGVSKVSCKRVDGKLIVICQECDGEFEPWVIHLFAMICPLCHKDFRIREGRQ